MAIDISRNEVTVSRLYSVISGLWSKVKDLLNTKLDKETAQELSEITAAAIDGLNSRVQSLEHPDINLGTRTADEIDSQVLKIGGADVKEMIDSKQDSLTEMTDAEVTQMLNQLT